MDVRLELRYGIMCVLIYLSGFASSDKVEVNLYKHLMDPEQYEPAIRPTPDHRLTTNVTFGFLLHQVINVDEKNQQLTTSSWMNVNWMDQRLRWNHSEWGGLKLLHIPHLKVWRPDIILTNNADPEYKEAAVSTDVFVTPDGNVTWLYFAIYQSSCQIRVRFYPFDDQDCMMTFASWSHDGSDVNLLLLTEEGDLSNYVNSSEWEMLEMTAHRRVLNFSVGSGPWPVIEISIRLKRRPLFYVFNHILPCVLISIMSMLGFYIPAETGEKVTMCITTMLSMGVFLKTITESMPPTSEAVPLIGMYYGVSLFIVCAATCVNVITLNVHNRGYKNTPDPVPPWARKLILGYMANLLCIKVYPADSQMVHLAEKRRQMANDEELLTELAMTRNYAEAFGTPVVLAADTFDTQQTPVAAPNLNSSIDFENLSPRDSDRHESEQLFTSRDRVISFSKHVPTPNCNNNENHLLATNNHHPYQYHFNRSRPTRATVASDGMNGRKCSSISGVGVGVGSYTANRLQPQQHQPLTCVNSVAGSVANRKISRSPSIYDYDYELEALRRLNSQASLIGGALSLMHAPLRNTKSAATSGGGVGVGVGTANSNANTNTNAEHPPSYNSVASPNRKVSEISRIGIGGHHLASKKDSVASAPSFRARTTSTRLSVETNFRQPTIDDDSVQKKCSMSQEPNANCWQQQPQSSLPPLILPVPPRSNLDTESNANANANANSNANESAGERLARMLKEEFEERFHSVLKKVYLTLEQNELRMALQEERSRIMWEWKQLAIIVDRLLLLLFVLATGLTTFLILFEPIIFEDKLPGDDDIPPII